MPVHTKTGIRNSLNKLDYMNSFEAEENMPGSMLDFMADRLIESLKTKEKFIKNSLL